MREFELETNRFLKKSGIKVWYHRDYIKYKEEGNPDFLVELKNTYNNQPDNLLNQAKDEAKFYIRGFLSNIKEKRLICVVPRSKAYFAEKQLYFKKAVKEVISELIDEGIPIIDGTDCIQRHTNVKTTHLAKYDNEGDIPCPGITLKTCNIDDRIKDANIILIDDIYTKSINVIEDCVQALFDKGAKSVEVYCVANTIKK